ncbi:MAG: MotA/TolQ/ExbB proton channel family protein [Bryobacteraceae bacterium]|nr:MotA/TolQ/ExbB proton channel family protein [Bryobacteraceae bacterium]MDW8376869.1 MotA/TolQ/ExbB proton channel family protein [Bryobacterales bacterium]
MQSIHDLLYLLSNAFLAPTLVGTLLAFAYTTFVVGQFLSDWADHRSNRRALKVFYSGPPTQERFEGLSWRGDYARFCRALVRHRNFPALVEKEVADLEHDMAQRVEQLSILAKVGPMLGLIGTLIPLQPALAGLARGDMQAMGANLQIGFTTTVLGLLVGGTCYAISSILRTWQQQSVTDFHFLLGLWMPGATSSFDEPLQQTSVPIPVDGLEGGSAAIRAEKRG